MQIKMVFRGSFNELELTNITTLGKCNLRLNTFLICSTKKLPLIIFPLKVLCSALNSVSNDKCLAENLLIHLDYSLKFLL